jgi:hypothetical protein
MDAAHVTRAARTVMDCMDGQRGDADRTETLAGHAWARSGRGGRPVGMAWPVRVAAVSGPWAREAGTLRFLAGMAWLEVTRALYAKFYGEQAT